MKAEKEPKSKREEHMAHRRSHGLTYRELANEFGLSKSTIHRKLTEIPLENDDAS